MTLSYVPPSAKWRIVVSDPEEVAALLNLKQEKNSKLLAKWFRYKEYLTVMVDTEAGTCTVVDL